MNFLVEIKYCKNCGHENMWHNNVYDSSCDYHFWDNRCGCNNYEEKDKK